MKQDRARNAREARRLAQRTVQQHKAAMAKQKVQRKAADKAIKKAVKARPSRKTSDDYRK